MTEVRLVYADGRPVPRPGDLVRVLCDVRLEGGGLLPADQNVLVTNVAESNPDVVGIIWRDKDGTHVMAITSEKIEVVP